LTASHQRRRAPRVGPLSRNAEWSAASASSTAQLLPHLSLLSLGNSLSPQRGGQAQSGRGRLAKGLSMARPWVNAAPASDGGSLQGFGLT
jgi:hypothetical protein